MNVTVKYSPTEYVGMTFQGNYRKMASSDEIQIVHLRDVPDPTSVVATLVRWFVAEWRPWYGPGGKGDAEADLAACRDRDRLPVCIVALDGDGQPLGTAALRAESVGDELCVGPWLVGLLVGEPARRRGVGSALIAAAEVAARRLGCDAVYCSTDSAEGLLERRGWAPVAASVSLRGPVAIYRLPLSGETD